MNCPKCNASMGIEDKYCPFCGTPNEFAKQHQAEMAHFEEAFEETREQVLDSTKKSAGITGPLIVVIVLIFLNIIASIFSANAWKIGTKMKEKQIEAHMTEYQMHIDDCISRKAYAEMYDYFTANDLETSTAFRDFNAVTNAAYGYRQLVNRLIAPSSNYAFIGDNYDTTISQLTRYVDSIYNTEASYSYNAELYLSEEHLKQIREIRQQATALLATYTGLTVDEINNFPSMSTSAINNALRGGIPYVEE